MNARSGLLLAVITLSLFVDGLDGTIVNVALPNIAGSYGISTADTSWVITLYYLVMAGLILIFGRLCDRGAIKRVLLAGFAVFSLGSLICGLSPSFELLLASRALQGVGGAMLAASGVMLGVKFLPKEQLGLSMSLVVIGMSVGVALGPSLGAVITSAVSWHWVFFINVPIGVAALLMAYRAVPADAGVDRGDLDVPGSAMLFVGIVTGLYAVESIPSEGLGAVNGASAALCVVLLAAFVLYERRLRSPTVDLHLFRNLNFDLAVLGYALVNLTILGAVYLLPFYLRQVAGLDILGSGLVLSVQAVSMVILAILAGRYSERRGNRNFAIASCAMMLVFSAMALIFGEDTPLWYICLTLLACGSVWGIGGGPMGTRIVNSVADEQRGSGSSMVSFVMYFSSALGTALFAGIFALGSGQSGPIEDVAASEFMDGFALAMAVAVVLSVVAVVSAWAVRFDRRRRGDEIPAGDMEGRWPSLTR